MAEIVNPQVTDAVTTNSVSTIADQPAILSNLALANLIANTNLAAQNAIANQQAMNELGVSVVGKIVNMLSTVGPLEARSAVDILTDNELAETLAGLKSALQAIAPAKD
jgi:hypothetical protein